MNKKCSKCGEFKLLEEFNYNCTKRDGRSVWCKDRRIMKEHSMEWIISSVILFILMWWAYREGRSNGRHMERMRLLDVMQNISMDSLSSNERFGVLWSVNYMVTKLREE